MAHIYKFYSTLLKNLNVPQHNEIYYKIIQEDYEFYKNYAYLKYDEQYRGGKNDVIKYKHEGYTFIIHKDEEEDRTSFHVYNEDNIERNEVCMLLFIPKKENYVYLQSISYYQNCYRPEMPKTKGGSLLLRMTLNFIDDIKSKYKLKYIQLKDNSTFTCEEDGKSTPICNLYMLTRGDTWYGKYGFIPFDPIKKQIDIDTLVDYKTNQKLVKIIKIKCTDIKEYLIKATYKLNLNRQYPEHIIDQIIKVYGAKSIQDFFRDFMEKYDTRCHIFNEIYKNFMMDMHLVDLYNKTYYKPI